ncbi:MULTISPECIES: twin-arginine translocase TatA/TatE family subunit [Brevibacterium]|jgi:sec-independent protein translocase protein TatB|uniref:Twin-arginine translocase TatA/TatE family subunit n=1 Tax=Brevibacterium salitolerans TaxID=1403566 RepID=A0ABN2WDG3_9MICO|nr:twin-arginine translocase TatA/TatE family subunit [Brevibacterium sp.]
MFGINGFELVILVVVALLVIGPKRLPEYAAKLRELVKDFRRMAEGAKDTVKKDFGPALDDYDWRQYDPRQYDPRRIVREALAEEDAAIQAERERKAGRGAGTASARANSQQAAPAAEKTSPLQRHRAQQAARTPGASAPFDPEAT